MGKYMVKFVFNGTDAESIVDWAREAIEHTLHVETVTVLDMSIDEEEIWTAMAIHPETEDDD